MSVVSHSVRPYRWQPIRLPSLGFSRQEYWSWLPFPSPVHESEKWKWSCSVLSHSSRPHRLQPTTLLHPWDFPGKSTGVGCHCLLQPNTLGISLRLESAETPESRGYMKVLQWEVHRANPGAPSADPDPLPDCIFFGALIIPTQIIAHTSDCSACFWC